MNADDYAALTAYTAQFRGDDLPRVISPDAFVTAERAIKEFTAEWLKLSAHNRAS